MGRILDGGVNDTTPNTVAKRTSTGSLKIADAVNVDEAVALGQIITPIEPVDFLLFSTDVTLVATEFVEFDLTTIPGGLAQYRQIRIEGSYLRNDGFGVWLRFNGSSDLVYDLGKWGLTTPTIASNQNAFKKLGYGDDSTMDNSGSMVIYIDSPAISRWKTIRGWQVGGFISVTNLNSCDFVGTWKTVAALTSIRLMEDTTDGMRGLYRVYGTK